MVDIAGQELDVGDNVLVALNGGKLTFGKIKRFHKENTEFRRIEICLVLLESNIEVMKLNKQLYKINGSAETKRENDTKEI